MIEYSITPADYSSASLGSIRDGFGEALLDLGRKQWNVVAVAADLGGSLRMEAFAEAFPQRFFEMGVAEQNMIGVAAGLAKEGLIPFAASFAAFSPGRSYDQIRTSVCYSKNAVKIVGGHAGITVGPDGATHQMCEDLAMMRALPNMQVFIPSDTVSAGVLTRQAATVDTPVYLRLSRVPTRTLLPASLDLSQVVRVKKGNDVTIITMGVMVDRALATAFALENQNVSVEVLVVTTLKPLDTESIIASTQKTGRVLTLEEHQVYGGLGSAIAEVLGKYAPAPLEIVGIEDTFGESGQADELLDAYGFSTAAISKRVLKLLARTDHIPA